MHQTTYERDTRFTWWHTLLAVLGGLIGAVFIGGALLVLIYGLPEDNVFPTQSTFWVLLPTQALFQFFGLKWVSTRWGTGSFANDFGFEIEAKHVRWIFVGPVALWGLRVLNTGYRAVLDITEGNPQSLIDSVLEVRATAAVIPIVVSTVVLAPILEELTFRGLLYRTAVDKGLGRVAVAVITAAAFMVAHVLDSELWTKAGSATLVTLFLFGLILAEIRRRTGSLAAAIFTHSGFNLTTIVALLFFTESATGV